MAIHRFKLLAIHVLEGCMPEIRKILPDGNLYQFFNYYDFVIDQKTVVSITQTHNPDFGLYNIKRNEEGEINIDISAIVGKNGSGKSSILDLFYAFCLCISKDQKDIKNELKKLEHRANWTYISSLFRSLRLEVFYWDGNTIKSIKYDGSNEISTYSFNPKRKTSVFDPISEFCYTIALNYSIHGLNELNSPWLSPMFHKNDGYQAPLVINPYREEGNIDINREYELANSRLIQNLPLYGEANPEIINEKYLHDVRFIFTPTSLDWIFFNDEKLDVNLIISEFETKYEKSIFAFFNQLSSIIVGETLSNQKIVSLTEMKSLSTFNLIAKYRTSRYGKEYIEFWFIKYIIRKIFKTCLQYSVYRDKFIIVKKNRKGSYITFKGGFENDFFSKLLLDKSHITLKLRQTLVMWKERYFFDKIQWGEIINGDDVDYFGCFCSLNATQLGLAIGFFDENKSFKENLDLERVPGGILKPQVFLKRKNNAELSSKIEVLSSGEQQFIFTIQTILYHLKNLDSVFDGNYQSEDNIHKYKNVLILLDEVELYFHPEYQRLLINELITQIKLIKLKKIKNINIIFSSHSPFIISDIPQTNILKIERGTKKDLIDDSKTFGANIHDLLANDFFMSNGFMGEFSKGKINEVIANLRIVILKNKISEQRENNKSKRNEKSIKSLQVELEELLEGFDILTEEKCKQIISLIGEPILYGSLIELFSEAYKNKSNGFIDQQIEFLQNLKKKK